MFRNHILLQALSWYTILLIKTKIMVEGTLFFNGDFVQYLTKSAARKSKSETRFEFKDGK
jgi:hypothetical protein